MDLLGLHLVSCSVILPEADDGFVYVNEPTSATLRVHDTCVLPSGGRRTLMACSNNWQKIDRGAFQLEGEK